MRYGLASVAAVLLLSSCALPGIGRQCTAQIDWVDFIQIGSTQYVAGPGAPEEVDQRDLGDVVTHVKFRLSGNVCDPNYRPKDGDASFLDPGTPVYQLAGYAPAQAVAASRAGRLIRYDANPPPR